MFPAGSHGGNCSDTVFKIGGLQFNGANDNGRDYRDSRLYRLPLLSSADSEISARRSLLRRH